MQIRGARTGRSLRLAVAAIVLIDLAVLGTDGFLLTHRATTTVVDLQHALVDFRSSGGAGGAKGVVSASADGAETPVTSAGTASSTTPSTVASVGAQSATTAPAAPAAGGSSTSAASPSALLSAPPTEGVYQYRTSGGESVSVLAAHHDYPSITYAAVRRTSGCGWQIHAAVVQEHVDERTICSGPDGVQQVSQSREVTFFGTTDGGTFTCAPPFALDSPTAGVGARSQSDCGDGKGSTARLVRTTLGRGTVVVGGTTVAVIRIRIDGTITGRIRGTSTDLLTLVASTGLPVRWERSVDSLADAFGSTVRYQEQAQFDVVSLTPTT